MLIICLEKVLNVIAFDDRFHFHVLIGMGHKSFWIADVRWFVMIHCFVCYDFHQSNAEMEARLVGETRFKVDEEKNNRFPRNFISAKWSNIKIFEKLLIILSYESERERERVCVLTSSGVYWFFLSRDKTLGLGVIIWFHFILWKAKNENQLNNTCYWSNDTFFQIVFIYLCVAF